MSELVVKKPGSKTGPLGRIYMGLMNSKGVGVTTRRTLGVLIFLGIAEFLSRTGILDPRFVPPASQIILEAFKLCTDVEFLQQLWETLKAWFLGLGASILLGAAAGYLLGSSRFLYKSTQALFDVIRPIPSVALIPFGILIFQQGMLLKIVLIIYASSWPILFNVTTAVRNIDTMQRETARAFGIRPIRQFFQVTIPSTIPYLATGIRIASPIALVLTISVGMLGGGTKGLGVWILDVSSGPGRMDLVFAGTFIAGLLGALSNVALSYTERVLLPWHPAHRPKESE